MTRIATFSAASVALDGLRSAQTALAQANQQVATGKKAANIVELGEQTASAAAARSAQAKAAARVDLATMVENRLTLQENALEGIEGAANDFRMAMSEAIGSNAGFALQDRVARAFERMRSGLMMELDGRYLFSGTSDDTPPVNVSTLTALAAVPVVDDVFDNGARAPSVEVEEGVVTTVGQLASSFAAPLMDAFRQFQVYVEANGPFGQKLTDAQTTFLTGLVQTVTTATAPIHNAQGVNGQANQAIQSSRERLEATEGALQKLIDDVETADIAEAMSRLQAAQVQYQASAQTFAQLSRLSLLDFLR
jgi:flagellar hook-associated protein 3 FlgL